MMSDKQIAARNISYVSAGAMLITLAVLLFDNSIDQSVHLPLALLSIALAASFIGFGMRSVVR